MSGETKTCMSEIVSADPHLMHGTLCFWGTREQVERYRELAAGLMAECAVS